jgi:hypothetical protein
MGRVFASFAIFVRFPLAPLRHMRFNSEWMSRGRGRSGKESYGRKRRCDGERATLCIDACRSRFSCSAALAASSSVRRWPGRSRRSRSMRPNL